MRNRHAKYLGWMGLLLVLAFGLVSCALSRSADDIRALKKAKSVVVRLNRTEFEGQVLVAWYEVKNGKPTLSAFKVLSPGLITAAVFVGSRGTYEVTIHHDKNANLKVDKEEPTRVEHVRLHTTDNRVDLKVDLPKKVGLPSDYAADFNPHKDTLGASYPLAFGEINKLQHEKFSAEAAKLGMWEPFKFLQTYGAGVYMLEEYDPDRIPVVFVNGLGGYAKEYRELAKGLDLKKYQLWYFLYPSGMRLKRPSKFLANILDELRGLYQIPHIHVISHSMGGLVARGAILRLEYGDNPGFVSAFVSVATPWNGHKMAQKGAETLKNPVQSWIDMSPGSDYINGLFEKNLLGRIPHILVGAFFPGSGDDGSIALESQLALTAQKDAAKIRIYEGGHVEVLKNKEAIAYIRDELAKHDE